MTTQDTWTEQPRHDLSTFNAFGPDIADAYSYFEQARRTEPVFFSAAMGSWCVTRHDDIRAVTADPETFSSAEPVPRPTTLPPEAQRASDYLWENSSLLTLDPPRHRPIRRVVHEGISPRMISTLEPAIREVIARHVAALPDTRFDLVGQFADPALLAVLMRVVGFPEQIRDELRTWLQDATVILVGHAFVDPATLSLVGARLMTGFGRIEGILAERRSDPRDDLLTFMATREVEGTRLTPGQAANNALGLVLAGWETTANALANIILALLREPALWSAVARREVALDRLVAEGLRYDSPTMGVVRIATRAVTLAGVDIRAGERVVVLFPSGNHDPEHVPSPAEFRLDRAEAPRLVFGHGIHICVGAPLARLILGIALELLTERFPNARLESDEPPAYKPIALSRGPAALWLLGG